MGLAEAVVVVADPQALANDQSSLWLMMLGDLKALYDAYYSAHWRSYGDPYYGDHLMYQRLYGDLVDEIDSIAERALGITGNDAIVEPTTLLSTEMSCLKALVMPGEFAGSMLEAEKRFLQRLKTMLDTLRAGALLSDGTENLIQGIADKHEEHVYILSRRIRRQ